MGCFELPAPIGDPEKSRIDPAMNGIWIDESGDFDGVVMIFEPYDKRTWLVRWMPLEDSDVAAATVERDEQEFADAKPEDEVEKEPADTTPEPVMEAAPSDDEADAGDDSGLAEEVIVSIDDRSWLEKLEDGDLVAAEGIALFKTWKTRIRGENFITMEFRVEIDSDNGMTPRVWWGARVWLTEDDKLAIHFINNDFDGIEAGMSRRDLERVIRRNHDNSELYFGDEPILLTRVPLEVYDQVKDILEDSGLAGSFE
jgi:hypothetical protein